ncbi:hypothetical protein [Peribacillus loiseleuriae]|uniref:hypothetical protein n=1 Tax=Peribacillus loiseleuriae TaxID=1679170 RepID=UPI003D02D5AE
MPVKVDTVKLTFVGFKGIVEPIDSTNGTNHQWGMRKTSTDGSFTLLQGVGECQYIEERRSNLAELTVNDVNVHPLKKVLRAPKKTSKLG